MRVVFMGTPSFAVPSLRALARDHEVVAVYSRPDSVSGRGRTTRPSPVKAAATSLGLWVETPATLRSESQYEALARFRPDIGVVAAYGLILPREVLDVPRYGFVNVHASLLPRWRGAAPIQRAILAGDVETGVSIMRMEERLDTGPYCEQVVTVVGEKDFGALVEELSELGARAVVDVLLKVQSQTCVWTRQDDSMATYAAKVTKTDVCLSPDLTAEELLRRIRASSDHAPARAVINGGSLRILGARTSTLKVQAGRVGRSRHSLVLGTARGSIEVVGVKPDGRNEMDVAAWLRGAALAEDASWGSVA